MVTTRSFRGVYAYWLFSGILKSLEEVVLFEPFALTPWSPLEKTPSMLGDIAVFSFHGLRRTVFPQQIDTLYSHDTGQEDK